MQMYIIQRVHHTNTVSAFLFPHAGGESKCYQTQMMKKTFSLNEREIGVKDKVKTIVVVI